ncbi:MAG: archease [Gemmatimonadetes bacterium]|nr:archease [Gemmatimonadota bacterium]
MANTEVPENGDGGAAIPDGPSAELVEDHVGELRLTIVADSLPELFSEAARRVSAECGPVDGPPGPWEPVELTARDVATLLVDWLNELIGRSEVEGRAYDEVRGLSLSDRSGGSGSEIGPGVRLVAQVRGRTVSTWESPLKAATYHSLVVAPDHGRWRATVLLDV